MDSIISGAMVSTDTTNIISIPESEISFRCGTISVGKVSSQFQNMVIFSPDKIKGNKIITQTFSFDVPYRTTNLLMITSPGIEYILIGTDAVIGTVNKTLPKDAKKKHYGTYSAPLIQTTSFKTKLIVTSSDFPGSFPTQLGKLADNDVEAVKISGDVNKGNLEFYQKRSNSWVKVGESTYLGKGALIGAVYANFEMYNCSVSNAVLKSAVVSSIYLERTTNLLGINPACDNIYNSALDKIDSITSMRTETLSLAYSNILDLENINKDAQKNSCPLIY